MRYLSIKNLKKHQHYKDRRPPWIKLHAEVLDDYAFGRLQDASKAHLMLLWVLASRLENKIPYDLAWIQSQIQSTSPVDVEAFIQQGFIVVGQDDSGPLASREQSAMPETETETEYKSPLAREAEIEPQGGLAERLPVEYRGDLQKLLAKTADRSGWVAEIAAMLDGMPGHRLASGAQLGQAVREFMANGKAEGRSPVLRQFRRYVDDVVLGKSNAGETIGKSANGTQYQSPEEMQVLNRAELKKLNASREARGEKLLRYEEVYAR